MISDRRSRVRSDPQPALRISSSGLRDGDVTAPYFDQAQGGKTAQATVDVLSARSHEACKALLRQRQSDLRS